MKELANEFEGKFKYLEENAENCKTFSVLIEKEIQKIHKDGNEDYRIVSYKMKFINSAKFMESFLSNLIDNLAEGIHKIK